jgi:hypothetical protein
LRVFENKEIIIFGHKKVEVIGWKKFYSGQLQKLHSSPDNSCMPQQDK